MAETQLVKKRDLNDLIQSDGFKNQIALALPKFIDPDRMLRIAVTQIRRSEKLQECSQDSLLAAIMTASQMGIEVDGRNGHLIPRWNPKLNDGRGGMEAQFQPDYKGLVQLVRMNDKVQDIYADLVRDNDKFSITKGLHRDLVHEIDIRKPRGKILGAYAVIIYSGGVTSFEFMDLEELYAIRERSDGYKAYKKGKANSCVWISDEGEMMKKTVLKRLMKLADISGDTADRLRVEDERTMEEIPIARAVVKSPELPAPSKQLPAPEPEAEAEPEPINGDEPVSEPEPRDEQESEPMPQEPEQPRRQTRKPRPQTVNVETQVTHAPEEAPAPAPKQDQVQAPADKLRAACRGYSEDQILKVLITFNLCEPSVTNLDQAPIDKLNFALTDTATLLEELKDRFIRP
jgi:recombination protein RecT